MPTPHFRSQLAAALLGMLGTAFLVNSLSVHPEDKGDKASATQSKESSSGSSSGASTTQGGAAGAGGMNTVGASKLSQSDERMVKQIAEANLAEISAGKLAQDKAQSDEVKSFAKKMVDDHTKALDDLKQLAQSKGVTLPTEPSREQMAQEKKLQALSGEKFDRQYLQQAGDRQSARQAFLRGASACCGGRFTSAACHCMTLCAPPRPARRVMPTVTSTWTRWPRRRCGCVRWCSTSAAS